MAHRVKLKAVKSNRGTHKKKVKQGGKTVADVLAEIEAKEKRQS